MKKNNFPTKSTSESGCQTQQTRPLVFGLWALGFGLSCFCGCAQLGGYSGESLFPKDVETVYVQMFDNQSFWRGVEYDLTDALVKRIEVETPYKVVSSPDRADTVISGQLTSVTRPTLSTERETGRAMEREVELMAVVNWKNLKTGQLLVDNTSVGASASYSEWQQQGFDYASTLAANNLARRIVELMEKQW
ncbi:LptE family protein [Planctomycetota bacterium]